MVLLDILGQETGGCGLINIRQLAYGLLSYWPWTPASLYVGTGGTDSAEYCYAVWLRHLLFMSESGVTQLPGSVVELGPGDSIGVGLAAVASGVQRYVAVDVVEHAIAERNLALFDRIVELVRGRAPMPGLETFPEMTFSPAGNFPAALLADAVLEPATRPDRIQSLRAQLRDGGGQAFRYRAPWHAEQVVEPGSVDLVMSQAVLEHVEDLAGIYRASFQWLRAGGHASHQIDFRSHGLFSAWDGHWTCKPWLWRMFRGRREYLINRLPLGVHLECARQAGFEVVKVIRQEMEPSQGRVADDVEAMSAQDRRTAAAYLLLRRPGESVHLPGIGGVRQ
jgi:hypothetical protein